MRGMLTSPAARTRGMRCFFFERSSWIFALAGGGIRGDFFRTQREDQPEGPRKGAPFFFSSWGVIVSKGPEKRKTPGARRNRREKCRRCEWRVRDLGGFFLGFRTRAQFFMISPESPVKQETPPELAQRHSVVLRELRGQCGQLAKG